MIEPATFQAQQVAKPLAEVSEPGGSNLGVEPQNVAELDPAEASPPDEASVPRRRRAEGLLGDARTTANRDDHRGLPEAAWLEAIVNRRRRNDSDSNPLEAMLAWRPSTQTLTASGGATAIVVGLLLALTWVVRKCAPKAARPLPREVVEVLGRASLGGKQTTQLIRVGPKLVLVAITPEGVETLTEVTEPGEVARIVAACESSAGKGSAASFDQLLEQLSNEPSEPAYRASSAAPPREPSRDASHDFAEGLFDPRSIAAAYANTPGGRGDA